jgi:hypothetical protein
VPSFLSYSCSLSTQFYRILSLSLAFLSSSLVQAFFPATPGARLAYFFRMACSSFFSSKHFRPNKFRRDSTHHSSKNPTKFSPGSLIFLSTYKPSQVFAFPGSIRFVMESKAAEERVQSNVEAPTIAALMESKEAAARIIRCEDVRRAASASTRSSGPGRASPCSGSPSSSP